MRRLWLNLIPVLAVLFIDISGELYAQAPDSCREEAVSAADATCDAKYPCLKMTLCGLIGFVHDKVNNSVTGYFVDANPESKAADQYPPGVDLSNPDLDNVYARHYVELTLKQGRYTEYDAQGKQINTCSALSGVFCSIKAQDRSPRDLDLYFLPQGIQDPKPKIDVTDMLDESKLRSACSSLTSSSTKYFHLKPGLNLTSNFLEAIITLDRGTSIFAEQTPCPDPERPNYKLAQADPFKTCEGGPIKLSEKVKFEWLGAKFNQFKLMSRASGSVFVFEPVDDAGSVVLAFTNEVRDDMHHDAPFRWLYRLTSNDQVENHFLLPSLGSKACELLGSKCPVLLLDSP